MALALATLVAGASVSAGADRPSASSLLGSAGAGFT